MPVTCSDVPSQRRSDSGLGETGGDTCTRDGDPAVFWLRFDRAHDAQLIDKVNACLPNHDTAGLD